MREKKIFILRYRNKTEYYTTISGIFERHTEAQLGCTIKDLYPVPTEENPYVGKCRIHAARLYIKQHSK